MNQQHILKSIDEASKVIGKTWPLYSFVTSNPLSGYEKLPFVEAVDIAKGHLNAEMFLEASLYRKAWTLGEIGEEELVALLNENGLSKSPEFYLQLMESQKRTEAKNSNHDLDRIMAKWLAAFMDEGLAEWEMPNKKDGFYKAWRTLAKYDGEILVKNNLEIPKTSSEALAQVLKNFSKEDYVNIFTYHLAALPGWTGYINYRSESNSLWQQAYPISLEDYLAVRLWIAQQINTPILLQSDHGETDNTIAKLQYIWLKALERSWQNQLVKTLEKESIAATPTYTQILSAYSALCLYCYRNGSSN